MTGLVHLRFERFQTRQQRQDENVLLFVREAGKVGLQWFLCHAGMINRLGIVYNRFIAAMAAEQSSNTWLTNGK